MTKRAVKKDSSTPTWSYFEPVAPEIEMSLAEYERRFDLFFSIAGWMFRDRLSGEPCRGLARTAFNCAAMMLRDFVRNEDMSLAVEAIRGAREEASLDHLSGDMRPFAEYVDGERVVWHLRTPSGTRPLKVCDFRSLCVWLGSQGLDPKPCELMFSKVEP